MAERPTETVCETCGTTFDVPPRGRIPKRCPDCRASSRSAAAPTPDAEPLVGDAGPVAHADWPKELRGGVFTTSDGAIHVGLTAATRAQQALDGG